MNVLLWIVQALLAVAFLGAGCMKSTMPIAKLEKNMIWVKSVPPLGVRALGVLEILGAIGLILPGVLHIATILTSLAAIGLALIMVGAMYTHMKLKEKQAFIPVVILLILNLFVIWGRLGAHHLS